MTRPGCAQAASVWDEARWCRLDDAVRRQALRASGEDGAWGVVVRRAREVMRFFTTSFFIVSRFLPRAKRDEVEVIYATVRYPDEVVDTFPLAPPQKMERLEAWAAAYERALGVPSLRPALEAGVPPFLAGFASIVRRHRIPPEHYRSFLDAMRLDVSPRPFATLDDLIDSYVYGSAVVVGYFLTYVYGAERPERFPEALRAARELGIGLQLTNFLRDVAEDQRRGRVYLPRDWTRAEGIERVDARDPAQQPALERVLNALSVRAAGYYDAARRGLDAFAPDSRVAIRACIDVYGRLNDRIRMGGPLRRRASVPLWEKLRVLPAEKYWRIPLAYLRP